MKLSLPRLGSGLLLLSSLLFGKNSNAQVATTYTFSQNVGTYTLVTGGTQLAQNANLDENLYTLTIPSFTFDGVDYTTAYVSTNGFITFGAPADSYFYEPISSTDYPYSGVISAFGGDIAAAQAAAGTRNLRTQQIGNEFVIQWQNVRRYNIAGERISFQIRLNTVTNEIKIVYGGSIIPGDDEIYPQIGLRGADNNFATNVNNREILAATGAWANSTAGTTEASTCYYNSANPGTIPAVGTTFTWTPRADAKLNNITVSSGVTNCPGNNETVSVNISNKGGQTIDFSVTPMTINASVTGTNPTVFTPVIINTGTLAPGTNQNFVIATGYDMSASGGTYNLSASVSVPGSDAYANNNSQTSVFLNKRPSVVYADVSACTGESIELTGTSAALAYDAITHNTASVAIPDEDPAGVNSPIVVSNASFATASAVTVTIGSLTHTYTSDLTLTLTAPNGSSIILALEPGSGDANFTNTVFSSTATDPISTGLNPFSGSFLPEESFAGLTGPANGTWQLNVTDNYAFDEGTLNDWSVSFTNLNSIVSYAWSPGTDLSSVSTANPTTTTAVSTSYAVTVTDQAGCTATDNVAVTINALPTLSAVSDDTDNILCEGTPVTLTASGTAADYVWDNSVINGTPFTATTSTTYSVTATDANNCSASATVTLTVNSLPTVNGTSDDSDNILCEGTSVTLTSSGTATNYSWNNSVTEGVAFEPAATATYIVTGTDANCSNTDTVVVTVNMNPTVNANSDAPSNAVCEGGSVTLSGSGTATNYTWDNGVTNGVGFIPAATATYTVTGTDGNNCSSTATITIDLNTIPTVTANSNAAGNEVCSGSSVILTGGGTATNFVWNNSVTNGTAFQPATTTTYTVTGLSAANCSATATITIIVNPLPNVSFTLPATEICIYDAPLTLSGGTPLSGTYSGTGVSTGSFDPNAAGLGMEVITYTFTDGNGCTASATDQITVDECLGVKETAEMMLQAYPNPGSGVFTIISDKAISLSEVTVVDAQGKMVAAQLSEANGNVLVDLSNTESGIYFLTVSGNGTQTTLRLVKQ